MAKKVRNTVTISDDNKWVLNSKLLNGENILSGLDSGQFACEMLDCNNDADLEIKDAGKDGCFAKDYDDVKRRIESVYQIDFICRSCFLKLYPKFEFPKPEVYKCEEEKEQVVFVLSDHDGDHLAMFMSEGDLIKFIMERIGKSWNNHDIYKLGVYKQYKPE